MKNKNISLNRRSKSQPLLSCGCRPNKPCSEKSLQFSFKFHFGSPLVKRGFVFSKAVEDEDGDQENIQIQLTPESSARKGGKLKGNIFVRRLIHYFFICLIELPNFV